MYPFYERMMANLQMMAVNPHPSNSPEIKIVRSHLIDEIEKMGLIPIIQDVSFSREELLDIFFLKENNVSSIGELWEKFHDIITENPDINSFDDLIEFINNFQFDWIYESMDGDGSIFLQNIMVKIDAPDTDRGVLFMAHYDSNLEGPGAADNMLSVVSLLEAMRSQALNKNLKKNLYFLFSDGEELGLTYGSTEGTKIFVKENSELKDKIDMVINFEAGGNRGALILFETSPNAYRLVETYKKSGAWLYGFSAMKILYNISRYNTDLTNFLNEGYNGLNFAAIEGAQFYHTMNDSYENLNPATAWHYLHTILSFANYAASNTLDELQKPAHEAAFFPFLPGHIVLMTDIVSHILCAIAIFFALADIALDIRNKQLKPALSTIFMCLPIPISTIGEILFTSASYLFYLPLLLMAITSLIKKWQMVYLAMKMVSDIIVLMLWAPMIISICWVVVVPKLL
jgi:hypothetical protein